MKDLVLADANIQKVIGDKVEGTDYWVDVVPEKFPVNGEDGGFVRLLFRTAVTFSGQITVATDPCSGSEDAHSIENVDPCQKERREFSTTTRNFQTRAIDVLVDVLSERVYDISGDPGDSFSIDRMIAGHVRPTATPPPSP